MPTIAARSTTTMVARSKEPSENHPKKHPNDHLKKESQKTIPPKKSPNPSKKNQDHPKHPQNHPKSLQQKHFESENQRQGDTWSGNAMEVWSLDGPPPGAAGQTVFISIFSFEFELNIF